MSDSRFQNLVDAHGRNVLNVALRVTGDVHLAQDVYQEVFLALWRCWSSCREDTAWGAYLYRATVRKAIELLKRQRSGAIPLEDVGAAVDSAPHPGHTLMLDELQQQLNASLAKLPKRQADVFVLARIEGLDHGRIAEILGCSRNTVGVSLYRAVKKLARAMKAYARECRGEL